jgi:hypothetical protein
MLKRICSGLAGTLLLLMSHFRVGYSQDANSEPVRLMFYNVENLFDVYDDTLKKDEDFLPGGLMRWNSMRYTKKINSLYKTIIAAGEWNPPALIGFCEVENRKVLEDLVYDTYLSKYNYRIIHNESPDQRGIDVCLIYRKDVVGIIQYKYWIPSDVKIEEYTTRSVLYVKVAVCRDTLHLFVNHWPSRRGGVLAGEDMRMKISVMIRQKADSINAISPSGAKIIIMGDFNSTPDDMEIKSLSGENNSGVSFVNLSEKPAAGGEGTYRYMGIWEMIDQVIVSDELLNCETGLYTDNLMLRVFKPDFLLKKDPKYPGVSPMSTYRGYRYQGGFSDHLPVLLDLWLR